MKLTTLGRYGLCTCLAAVALTGCADASNSSGKAQVVDGGTFTLGLSSDPGNLDPQMGAGSGLFTVTQFAYDALVSVDGTSGEIKSGLAKSWDVRGTTVSLTLAPDITCSDGAKLTPTIVADNLNFVADPKNQSPFLGTFLPVGATSVGDNTAGTVTITLAQQAPFVLNGLSSLPIVCPSGLADRGTLRTATAGTGPYKLVEAAPGDHYTYSIREGYTWGPAGATTATKGLPKTVVVKVVQNESTAANLLLSGGLNAAQVAGPDADRLDKAGLFAAQTPAIVGEQWYNHRAGRVTGDPKVRKALTQALDLGQLQKVLTSGQSTKVTTLAANQPVACPGDSVSSALPAADPKAAAALLDEAGWKAGADGKRGKDGKPLALTFLYQNNHGSGGDAAAELAVRQWKAVGVDATASSQNETSMTSTLFGAGDWDVAWVSLNLSSPDQLVPFLSGPAAPDGNNFAAISDPEYDKAVATAMASQGVAGCRDWLAAESGLIANATIVPFAGKVVRMFGRSAEFQTPGQLVPTSIRMLSK
ncbi:Oligopeptide ABC transporter, periplasmic oligopeptide-binding protein OppA (TC 3.A.1.5.1) [Alloactinosynnema sp. L-07]|uniref:ABC transporter substrate-binding protein n=1 Tax=Alloactinosynnema sp. L-07 TaxID=1653480 RepID=UPI00065EF4CF|nr:ABC transporter substrate-binding protein [Alloactinosynnema sp. L-07]CRK61994.1 Oligopeptide ABC transporter, periplasmic oligopeptide-binding protein OppA (TC 3.A.1.5.1) [Alloactinosynnema sp. L-07]